MNSTAGGDTTMDMVVTSWTPIWVTLLICSLQGILCYSFFLYRRHSDRTHYQMIMTTSTGHQDTKDDDHNENDTTTTAATAALQHCQLYESRQYTRSHRSPAPFELPSSSSTHHPPTTTTTSWWKSTLSMTNEALLQCVGLDTYMFLRVLSMGTRITGWGTLLSLILLPIYATGDERGMATEQFNLLTMARVEADGSSWRLYIAVIVWYAFIGMVLHEFWSEWKAYYSHRTVFDATGDMDMPLEYRYTVRVEQIPSHINHSETRLRTYLEHLFPNAIYETAIVRPTKALETLLTQRHKWILKCEAGLAAAAVARTKPKSAQKPPKQIKVKGTKVEAVPYYQSEIQRLNQEIDTLRSTLVDTSTSTSCDGPTASWNVPTLTTVVTPTTKDHTSPPEEGVETGLDLKLSSSSTVPSSSSPHMKNATVSPPPADQINKNTTTMTPSTSKEANGTTTSTAFVTFTSLRAKQAAIQCEWTGDPDTMKVFPAADPTVGTIWKNMTVPLPQQLIFQFQASCFFTVGILFWAVPVTFVTSISNLNSILEAVGLQQANPSAFWYGLVAGLLPVIMLAVLMIVLYMVITAAATNLIRYKSWPEVDAFCLYWHMLFQFANLWLILIGGSLFAQINSIIETPEFTPIIETIARAMPSSSVFFVNMIVCSSFNAFGMELSMMVKYIVTMIMNKISPEASQTQRQLDDKKKPPSLVWGQKVPPIIFVFMVSILYSKFVLCYDFILSCSIFGFTLNSSSRFSNLKINFFQCQSFPLYPSLLSSTFLVPTLS